MTPTEDIRAARHRLAARFDNDLDRIVADLRRQQRESGRDYTTLVHVPRTDVEPPDQLVQPMGIADRDSA